MTGKIAEKVKAFTEEHALFEGVHSAIIGVSGGADSMCLLDMLHRWEIVSLTVVHVHHGIRGEEADRDAEFVREACLQRRLPLYIVRADVPAIASSEKRGLEEVGRTVRYAAFRHIQEQVGADCIITAHTASDQVETILHNIVRGCGLSGLCGMRARTEDLVRPLLAFTRTEVEEYCAAHHVDYVIDSTNVDETYTRNVLRRSVLPLLRTINPSVDEALLRLAESALTDDDLLMNFARETVVSSDDGTFDRAALLASPVSVRYRVLRMALERIGCRSMEYRHFISFDNMLEKGQGVVQLPGGYCLRVSDERVCAAVDEVPTAAADIPSDLPMEQFPFTATFGDYEIRASLEDGQSIDNFKNVHKMFFKFTIDYDRISSGLYWRVRTPGDYIHPAGRHVGKSVKTLMSEWRMSDRDRYPLLCDADGIVLVPGYCCDERVRTSDGTKVFLVCTVNKISP